MPSAKEVPHTIRASEIGAYLFCRRAWWYRSQGQAPAPSAAQESGLAWHRRHGRRVLMAGFLRSSGWILILLGVVLAAVRLVE